jgi:hypothetical protein
MYIPTLPHEIIAHIINYIPDKMNASMACKLFQTILHNTKHTENINDPYYLSKNFKIRHGQNLNSITNHNCLNFITHNYITLNKSIMQNQSKKENPLLFPILYYLSRLLNRHCDINNVSKPDYINQLCISLSNYKRAYMSYIITFQTYLKSPDIVLLIFPHIKSIYFSLISYRLEVRKENINNICKEIDFFVENNVLKYEEIEEHLNIQGHIEKYNNLYEYITKKLKS